jgi:hypothetical protein
MEIWSAIGLVGTRVVPRVKRERERREVVRKYGWPTKKIFPLDAFFSCMQGRLLYPATANSFSRSAANEDRLGGRE